MVMEEKISDVENELQLNDVDVDMDENKEELSFCPSGREQFAWNGMSHNSRAKDGFKHCDIASVMVEDDGEPNTINLCKCCYNLRQGEW